MARVRRVGDEQLPRTSASASLAACHSENHHQEVTKAVGGKTHRKGTKALWYRLMQQRCSYDTLCVVYKLQLLLFKLVMELAEG